MPPWYNELFHPSLWDWGDVATWFTGIITAGSFWLGFTILRSDRMKEERAQASKVYIQSQIYVDPDNPDRGRQLHIGVRNDSDRPIYLYGLRGLHKNEIERYGTKFSFGMRPKEMEPGGAGIPIDYDKLEQTNEKRLDLIFIDSSHVGWKYNLGRQKLSKHRVKT